jgi:hypothetical protein
VHLGRSLGARAQPAPSNTRPNEPEPAMHARADGSLPPSPRWLKDDQYSTARYAAGLPWIDRHMLDKRRQVLVDTLDAFDEEAVSFIRRRRPIIEEALTMHE